MLLESSLGPTITWWMSKFLTWTFKPFLSLKGLNMFEQSDQNYPITPLPSLGHHDKPLELLREHGSGSQGWLQALQMPWLIRWESLMVAPWLSISWWEYGYIYIYIHTVYTYIIHTHILHIYTFTYKIIYIYIFIYIYIYIYLYIYIYVSFKYMHILYNYIHTITYIYIYIYIQIYIFIYYDYYSSSPALS